MPTKIRLSRHGKTHKAFYHIVVADGRAPRDGKFIEKIGTYDPISNPAEIELDFTKALDWIMKGAQPTDTARAILSHKGVMHKSHLLKGVQKGALTEVEAEAKFQKWLEEKEAKIAASRSGIDEKLRTEKKALFDAEVKVNEDRAAELAKVKAAKIDAKVKAAQQAAAEKAAKEEAEKPAVVAEVVETPKEEVEAPKVEVETPKVEVETPKVEVEAPKAEVETPKAEVEAPKAEVETPKAEVETPKAEVEAPKAEVEAPKEEEKTKE